MHAYDARFDHFRKQKEQAQKQKEHDEYLEQMKDPKAMMDRIIKGMAARVAPGIDDAARDAAAEAAKKESEKNHRIINGIVTVSVLIGVASLMWRFAK